MNETSELDVRPQIDLDEILAALESPGRRLPEDALRAAQRSRELVVPRLIEELRRVACELRAGNHYDGSLPFFALFLLAEFKAKESLPALLETLSLPGELPEDLFDDAITEVLPRVFATLADDQVELLEGLIRDRALNSWVRWEAAASFVYLVRDGRLARDEAGERLRRLLREAIDNHDEPAVTATVSTLDELRYSAAKNEFEEAFEKKIVDDEIIDMNWIESRQWNEQEFELEMARRGPTEIVDAVEELREWFKFSDICTAPLDMSVDDGADSQILDEEDPLQFDEEELAPLPLGTIKYTNARVGRNEPCPCGSGKKFKKCCGGR